MVYPIRVRMISKSQTERLVTPGEVIRAVEETFRDLGGKGVFHPVKEPIWMGEGGSNMLIAMPAHLKEKKIAGVKWVNMYPVQAPGLPSSYGNLLILSHEEDGQPYAIMEATAITTRRTAGGHGVVAAKYLARKDSVTLAVIGCGEEARAGIRGFLHAFPGLEELRVFDIHPEAMGRIEEEFGSAIRVICCKGGKEAVETADIVLLVTTATKPVVMFEWLKKGSFVAGLYSFNDLDPECSRKADKWFLGSRETDDLQIIKNPRLKVSGLSMDKVYGDLGEVVAGLCPGRERDEEIIVYTHMGMGALDVAVGHMIYQKAVEEGVGTVVDLA